MNSCEGRSLGAFEAHDFPSTQRTLPVFPHAFPAPLCLFPFSELWYIKEELWYIKEERISCCRSHDELRLLPFLIEITRARLKVSSDTIDPNFCSSVPHQALFHHANTPLPLFLIIIGTNLVANLSFSHLGTNESWVAHIHIRNRDSLSFDLRTKPSRNHIEISSSIRC